MLQKDKEIKAAKKVSTGNPSVPDTLAAKNIVWLAGPGLQGCSHLQAEPSSPHSLLAFGDALSESPGGRRESWLYRPSVSCTCFTERLQ